MSNAQPHETYQNSVSQPLAATLAAFRSEQGRSLRELSDQRPTLVVFLRHSGCTFCREALDDLRQARPAIESAGAQLALVFLSPESAIVPLLQRYGLDDVDRFADPERRLYRAFALERGSWWQVLGGLVFWRGFLAAIIHRHGFGGIQGDPKQMPGAFLLHRGQIVRAFRHRYSADRPDYANLACPR